jgi:hypothetical protein
MLSKEELSERITAGKKKWGKELIRYIQPLLEDSTPYDNIAQYIKRELGVQITEAQIANHKFRYYKELKKYQTTSQKSNKPTQKEEIDLGKIAYDMVYNQPKKDPFDLGDL